MKWEPQNSSKSKCVFKSCKDMLHEILDSMLHERTSRDIHFGFNILELCLFVCDIYMHRSKILEKSDSHETCFFDCISTSPLNTAVNHHYQMIRFRIIFCSH